jgi:hypothetical protein
VKLVAIPQAFEVVTGTRPHPATVCRYALKGCKGVLLETWMVGGHRKTTIEAVERFIQQRTAQTTPPMSADPVAVSEQLRKALA